MSHALYKLGRFAARRPWAVIGAWFIVSLIVVAASISFGRDLEDSFEAPGLDSTEALDLLTSTDSDAAGPTAQIVLSPLGDSTFYDSPEAQAALAAVQAEAARLPNVLGTNDPSVAAVNGPRLAAANGSVSPDGRVALIRVQYQVIGELDVGDLENLKELASDMRIGSPLQIELNGDLFAAFEEAETGLGEMVGLIAAVFILLFAFGSLIAMGLPIGLALFGLALGVSSMSLITYLIEIPSWAPQVASMVGLGVGIDYALFLVTRHREHLAGA